MVFINSKVQFKSPRDVMVAMNQFKNEESLYSIRRVIDIQNQLEYQDPRNRTQENEACKGSKLINNIKVKQIEVYLIDRENTKNIAQVIHIKYGHIGIIKVWLIFCENYFSIKN